MLWRALCRRYWMEKWHFRPPHSALKGFHQSPLWVRGLIPGKWRGERRGTAERERDQRGGASWHVMGRIKSVNRCDIIIKLPAGSLFSPAACRCRLSAALTARPTSFFQTLWLRESYRGAYSQDDPNWHVQRKKRKEKKKDNDCLISSALLTTSSWRDFASVLCSFFPALLQKWKHLQDLQKQ